jgi:hypothetical protein
LQEAGDQLLRRGESAIIGVQLDLQNQFAGEIDHASVCVRNSFQPRTPGEDGLEDQRITDTINEPAITGRAVKLARRAASTRGPIPRKNSAERRLALAPSRFACGVR